MALNDVYRASCVFSAPGADGNMVFTFHYRTTEVNTVISGTEEAFEIATEAVETIETLYLPIVSDSFVLEEVAVIGISDPLVGLEVASGTAGAVLGDPVALRSCPIVKLLTGIRGRSYNGRTFLLAPTEDKQAAGDLSSAYQADIITFITGIRRLSTQPSTNHYDLTIYSKVLSDAAQSVVDNLVVVWTINNTMGSLRGRQTV